MSERRTLIVTGLVLLLIIALVGAVIWYLVGFIRGRQQDTATQDLFPQTSANVVVVTPSPTTSAVANNPAPTQAPNVQAATVTTSQNNKVYAASNFQFSFAKNWGLTACSNSKNIELDPYNATDTTLACGRAIKPITVLVNQNSCVGGTVVTLGNTQARKVVDTHYVTRDGSGTQYHWCTLSGPQLDITHRVGSGTAFSQDDFSGAVEQMISTLTVSGS
jgi:hypothetical protein